MPMHIVRAAIAACLLFGLAGCQSSNATSAPTATAVASPTAAASAAPPDVVSMTLPGNWQKVELSQESIQSLITTLGPSNPQLAAALNQMLQPGALDRFLLFALDYDGGTYVGNANVSSAAIAGLSLDSVGPIIVAQLTSAGATNVESAPVTLPAGHALGLSYGLRVSSTSTTVNVAGRAFLVVSGDRLYQVTFSCIAADPAPCLTQADEMIQTFRIGT
jgi:hypothetical protein